MDEEGDGETEEILTENPSALGPLHEDLERLLRSDKVTHRSVQFADAPEETFAAEEDWMKGGGHMREALYRMERDATLYYLTTGSYGIFVPKMNEMFAATPLNFLPEILRNVASFLLRNRERNVVTLSGPTLYTLKNLKWSGK